MKKNIYIIFKKFIRSPSLLSPISSFLSLTLSPLSSLLSPMWQKLPYICNNFFYYNNLSITFLNYCTIEKSPEKSSGRLWRISHLTGTLTSRLDGQTTSILAQILRRCSTRREEQSYDGQSCF